MTLDVTPWFKEQWHTQVIHKFANAGFMLKGMTTPPIRIQGNKFYFLRSDKVEAQPFTRGDDVAVLNPDDDRLEIMSEEWDAAFFIYDWDETHLSVNEIDARQHQAIEAIGRRADKIVYENGVMASTVSGNQIVGDYSTGFSPYMALQGCQAAQEREAFNPGMMWCGLPELAWNQLMTFKIFSSSDYVGPDYPFLKGIEKRTWNQVHWFLLPAHLKHFNDAPTNDELRFRMWNQRAVGAGHNDNLRTEWERKAIKKAWFTNHTIDGAAIPLLDEGFVEFRIDADSAIESEVVRTEEIGA